MWSLPKYVDDMLSHTEILNNSIIGFGEAQIKSSDSTCKIIKTLNFFNVDFNNNENNGYRNDVGALNRFYANVLSILNYKNYAVDGSFNVIFYKTIHAYSITFSHVAISTSNKFYSFYNF